MTTGWTRLVAPTVLLALGLATWPLGASRAAEELDGADPRLEGLEEVPPGLEGLDVPPIGEAAPNRSGEPGLPGKDSSGPPPLSTDKADREDLLGGEPLDPARRSEMLDTLYEQLRATKDVKKAKPIADAIEHAWRYSGSHTIDLLMSHVDKFVLSGELDLAMQVLDAIAELAPDNAEAWHQRALVAVTQSNFPRALSDLKRALAIDPRHYKARRDLGAVLQQMGQSREALKAYQEALEANPFMEQARRAADKLAAELQERGI